MTCTQLAVQTYIHGPITIRFIPYTSSPLIFITCDSSSKFGHLFLLNNLLDASSASISKLFGDVEREKTYSLLLHELLKTLLRRNSAVMHQRQENQDMETINRGEREIWSRAVLSVAIKDKEMVVQAVEALRQLKW